MTIAQLIDFLRLELKDSAGTITDAEFILYVRKAINRLSGVLYRNGIQFSRKSSAFSTEAGTQAYSLPTDFGTPYGLYRRDTHVKLTPCNEDMWESIISAGEATNWAILDDSGTQKLYIKDTPASVISMVLHYYPVVDTSAYATTTNLPWGGKIDHIIQGYVQLLVLNTDESIGQADTEFMQDFENNLLTMFAAQTPLTVSKVGWNV